jgi:D-lyxose ketol-isomerase
MKLSCYNNRIDYQSKVYIFNSFSGALIEMEVEKADALMANKFHEFNAEETKLLKGEGIWVSDDCDEKALVKYMFRRERYCSECLSITIVPTFECNFACL